MGPWNIQWWQSIIPDALPFTSWGNIKWCSFSAKQSGNVCWGLSKDRKQQSSWERNRFRKCLCGKREWSKRWVISGYSLRIQVFWHKVKCISRNTSLFILINFFPLLGSINVLLSAQTCTFLRIPKVEIMAHFTIQFLAMEQWYNCFLW